MKLEVFALTTLLTLTCGLSARAQDPVPGLGRPKLGAVQIGEIDRTLDLLLDGLPRAQADKLRSTLSAQLYARAAHEPEVEREHSLVRVLPFLTEHDRDDLQARVDHLADQFVRELRGLGDAGGGRRALRVLGDFTLLNGANAGDRVSRWLAYSAKVGGVFGAAFALGVVTRWYGVRFHDPTSVEDGTFVILMALAGAGATGGFTYWEKTRATVLWLLAHPTRTRRKVARAMVARFWRRVAEGVENLPDFGHLRGERDPSKVARGVRRAILTRQPGVFDDCASLFM